MSGFLYVFYRFLKVLVRTTLRILHPRTVTLHEERLHYDYPGLLLSNHPNTMIDALRAAASNGPQVFFLANASLFAHPVLNWLLNKLYCIPIQRPKDVKGEQPLRNEQSFARSYAHLARGGTMYIAPEGGSEL